MDSLTILSPTTESYFVMVLLASTLRLSLPLVFAAFGGLLSERAGVVNIALEGMMLMGALWGAIATLETHNPWIGLLAGGASGLLVGFIFGMFVVYLKANQVVTGVAINMLAAGIPPFVLKILYGSTASSPSIPFDERFLVAPYFLLVILVGVVSYVFYKTPAGLWLQFAGEHPAALDSSGVRVNPLRLKAVVLGGLLAGLGGSTLSLFLSSLFSNHMTAGRGFMALAALILGKWKPIPTLLSCLLFGFFDALQMQLQGSSSLLKGIPVQFIQILPYLVTLIVLAGWVGKSRAPKKLGTPY
jgi:ABC-type uncharacterized transport system permease subunit